MDVLEKIYQHKIVAILRGVPPADVLPIIYALEIGGIKLVEVTLNSPGALTTIATVAQQMQDRMLVGAGTVLDATSANAAIEAGAKFIISPSVDEATIKITKRANIVSIPGAFTATEIVLAHNTGGDIIKLFPASAGLQYFKDIRGPLNHIPLMPTGGVNLENIADFLSAGAVAFGIGSALVIPQPINSNYLEAITANAKKYVAAIASGNVSGNL